MDYERTHWFKSSYSGGSGTECIEVADLISAIGVRDSKQPQGPRIAVQRSTWTEFVQSLRQPASGGRAGRS
ncbi:DUF397 domain-containing protein [Streptomyces sp. Ncost-T10-10d]|uniref:DUF397 domain-containing protein n=1 Tax=Streptomyces sp. Ncost-T10-10d TaxID=1839774 RepID=UPI00081D6ED2|nr:DUF397 domain-containing protein [Streptomyces sp. Ncost-T10-10d]SCF97369.1 protein of unknown function [Streptomyces sp. Ncost-T10-10d]